MKLIERASWLLKGLLLGGILMLSACSQQYGDGEGRSADNEAGQKIYSAQCASCHGPSGEGGSGGALIACAACGSAESLIAKIEKDMPSASNALKGKDAEDVALYVLDQFNGAAAGNVSRSMAGVATMSPNEAVYKIAFELAGRLPTEEEISTFSRDLDGERETVMSFMETDYFYERLKDMFNDSLLTDAHRPENQPNESIDQLYGNVLRKRDSENNLYRVIPDLNWDGDLRAQANSDFGNNVSQGYLTHFTDEAVARKPLLLVEYIARNNRDFREFVSGKYTVANRFSFEAFNNGDFGAGNMRVVDPDATSNTGALPFVDEADVDWETWSSNEEILDYLDVIALYRGNNPFSNDVNNNYILRDFPYDPRDLKAVQLSYNDSNGAAMAVGVPHSGVITDEIFLHKYTATETNMHRNRARMIYWFFAAKDLLAIEGNRVVEELEFEDFDNRVGDVDPTAVNPDCVACHIVMDGVAAAFENYDLRGLYDTTNPDSVDTHDDKIGWGLSQSEIETSGVGSYTNRELQWLGEQIANDAAYPKGIAQIVVRGLTGQEILGQPGLESPAGYAESYKKQSDLITKSASEFAESGFNIKELIYAITKSAYYRSTGIFYDEMADEFAQIGSMRYLPPELLNQKLRALNSGGWSSAEVNLYNLNSRMFMGGKDSVEVFRDSNSVSGIISAVTERMAVQESCDIVRNEFALPVSDRVLFTAVDDTTNTLAVSASGRLAQMQAIKSQIVKLHLAVLHKEVSVDSDEVDIAYELFTDVLSAEQDSSCNVGVGVNGTVGDYDRGAVREAWYAVMVYLLTDYRFIYS